MTRVSSVVLAVFACVIPGRASDDAIALLRQAQNAYKQLKTFRIDQEAEALSSSELHHAWQKHLIVLAVAAPDKVHFEMKEDTAWHVVVSDGRTVWRAIPYVREWSRTELKGEVTALKNGGSEGDLAIGRLKAALQFYPRLLEDIIQAEVVGHEDVEIGAAVFECTVVRVDYKPPPGPRGYNRWTRTYWVDEQSHLILKDTSVTRGHLTPFAPSKESEIRWLTRVTFLSLNEPVSEGLFSYLPPATFREVDRLERAFPRAATDLIGKPAPELSLQTLDGQPMRLSTLRGKIVLLDFWATWCLPCREQLPAMARLYASIKGQNVVLLGVDDDSDAETALRYVKERHYDWPILFGGPKSDARTKYRVDGIPTLVLIDTHGSIIAYEVGSGDVTERAIRAALRGQGVIIQE